MANLSQEVYYICGTVVLAGGVLWKALHAAISGHVQPITSALSEIKDNHLAHIAADLSEVKGDVKQLNTRVTRLEVVNGITED